MKNIEELSNQHYETINCLDDEEEIRKSISSLNYDNDSEILIEVAEKFQNDLNKIHEEISKEQEEDIKELLEEEEKETKLRLDICLETIKLKKDKNAGNIEKDTNNITIIFATNELTEKAYIENDIKIIPKEYYENLETCLNQIIENKHEGNDTIIKKLANNDNVKDIYESKDFKTRIYYRILPNNTVYIIGANFKKDNNPLRILTFVETRKKLTNRQYTKLKEQAKNNEINDNLIFDNLIKLDEIKKQIEEEKRVQNNRQK